MRRLMILLLAVVPFISHAQSKFWIYLKEDDDVKESDVFRDHRIRPLVYSEWLNAVSAYLDEDQLQKLKVHSSVVKIERIGRFMVPCSTSHPERGYYGALDQMDAQYMEQQGLTGKGITIGIIDIGFVKSDIEPTLRHVFVNKQLIQARDFVTPGNEQLLWNPQSPADSHGTEVWKRIGGYDADRDILHGMATGAKYYLARTDHGAYEFRGEEDNWVAAIEWLHSLGVRLVHSSLGYSIDFNDPAENHKPFEVDGKSTAITRAAEIAVKQKGMFLVLAAGSDGANPDWGMLAVPADAPGVLSVGATDQDGLRHAMSGIGPPFNNIAKPDLSCYSMTGTSFSAPVISGLVACMMEQKPSLTNEQIITILHKASHLYPFGNNYIGYGIPKTDRVLKLIDNENAIVNNSKELQVSGNTFEIKTKANVVTIFHKKDAWSVNRQQLIENSGKKVVVVRDNECARSTVVLPSQVIEIVWQ
jgi:subtilisin family serine protease